ncbi:MAG: hypothetical protein ACKO3K_12890 [Cuspidothrix sp.]
MSSSNKKLTVVQLDLVKSSTFTSEIEKKGGVHLTKHFIENIKTFVQSAFNSVVEHPDEAEEIQSCGGDAYRISFKDVNNAYKFVENFCQLVKDNDDKEPNKDKLIFRIGAATGTINFDDSALGLDRITGHHVLVSVSRLFTANPPGYFFVDEDTFNAFNQDIQNKFDHESILIPGKDHEEDEPITAYCRQMFIYCNTGSSEIKDTNDIVNYIFVIVTPHPNNKMNKKYFITAEFAQFQNNDTLINTLDNNAIILSVNIEEGYLENEIISVAVNKIINELESKPNMSNIFNPTPIIELFLPNNLLTKDFSIHKIHEAGVEQPVAYLYPFTVRSYARFSSLRSKNELESKFKKLKKLIDNTNDVNELINNIELEAYCHLIPEDKLKLKPDRFYIDYISTGTPLCLWTRCKLQEYNNTINDVYQQVFNISNNNFCKIYETYQKLLILRQECYRKHREKLIVGVLFDHDKLPKQISQLTSPNMARKI